MSKQFDDNDSAARGTLREDTESATKTKIVTNAEKIRISVSQRSIATWLSRGDILKPPMPLTTTYTAMDNALNRGLVRGGLYILAGQTGKGKSVLAQNLARRMSGLKDYKILLVTLEDSPGLALRRTVSAQSKVPMSIVSGYVVPTADETERINHAIGALSIIPLQIDCETSDIVDLGRLITTETENGTIVAIIDQSSWLTVGENAKSEYEVASKLSRELKRLARTLNIVVIVCLQFNRAGASAVRQGEKLSIQHLRSSGTWENDADGILMITSVDDETNPSTMHIEVGKHKHGIGDKANFNLSFHKTTQCIEDYDESVEKQKPRTSRGEVTLESLVAANFFTKVAENKQQLFLRAKSWPDKITAKHFDALLGSITELGPDVFRIKGERGTWWYSTSRESLNEKINSELKK